VRPPISNGSDDAQRDAGGIPEFLQSAFEWLPIGVLIAGTDGAIVMTNRELERLFGYPRAELIGLSVDALVPDASRPTHTDLRGDYGARPQPRAMGAGRELFGRRKDGSEVPVEVGLTPIQVGGGLFILASVIDVSERRRSQLAARVADQERLRFETLVSELGAEFINLRTDQLDHAIEDALARIVRVLDLDRSALFQLAGEDGDFVFTHQWTRPGAAPSPPRVSAREHFPWHRAQLHANELVSFATVDEVPDAVDREHLRRIGTKSGVTIPVRVGGEVWGAVSFAAVREARSWSPAMINRLRVIAVIFASVLARRKDDDTLRATLGELGRVRDRLRDENEYLRRELQGLTGAPAIVGHSAPMRRVLEQIRQAAPTDSPVLLVGETGTGKALLAARIHELSARRERALVRVHCAALSPASIDSDLFGRDQALSTRGGGRQLGRMELAHQSTVFLDEIADLPLDAQASLMHVLRDGQIHPLGGTSPVAVDVRVIAATRTDLTRGIAQGSFRDDLFYRLNVFTIHVPPLRDRPDDVPLLVWRFVDEFSERYGKPIDTIDKASMEALRRYSWPGNARELRNVVERALIVATTRQLSIPLPAGGASGPRREERWPPSNGADETPPAAPGGFRPSTRRRPVPASPRARPRRRPKG
jgi:PAS domain S-box-containing protein